MKNYRSFKTRHYEFAAEECVALQFAFYKLHAMKCLVVYDTSIYVLIIRQNFFGSLYIAIRPRD